MTSSITRICIVLAALAGCAAEKSDCDRAAERVAGMTEREVGPLYPAARKPELAKHIAEQKARVTERCTTGKLEKQQLRCIANAKELNDLRACGLD
jgi:hypothetical protein